MQTAELVAWHTWNKHSMTSGALKCLLVHRRDLREPLWLSRSCVCAFNGRFLRGQEGAEVGLPILPVRCEKPAYWNQNVITHIAHSLLL